MDEISRRILRYLADHPEASDTVEGIAQWWLLEQEIREQKARVERSLAELTAQGWLLSMEAGESRVRYRLNPARVEDVRAALAEKLP